MFEPIESFWRSTRAKLPTVYLVVHVGHEGREEFLKKLVKQDLFLARDLRRLGDALAKGKVAIGLGIGRSQSERAHERGFETGAGAERRLS